MTTNEIAHTDDDSELTVLPPAQPLQPHAVAQLREHAANMNTAYELADAMCGTALVPATYRGKPQDGAAAILYGAELGLTPIQSLQQIFVVHGTPAIYARTMVALLKRRGYRIWTESSTDEAVTVMGEAPDGTAESSTWTIERAEKAGYVPTVDEKTGKFKVNGNNKLIGNEKYLTDPQAMLYAKAAAEVSRKLAPDVLLGIAYTAEDLESESEQPPRKVRNEAASAPGVEELRARLAGTTTGKAVTAAPTTTQKTTSRQRTAAKKAANLIDPKGDQMKKLHALMNENGLGDREAGLAWIEQVLGTPVASTKDLTVEQATRVIDHLDDPSQQEPAQDEQVVEANSQPADNPAEPS